MNPRITVDPDICHGKPTIRGSCLLVTTILRLLAGGATWDELLADYPGLKADDFKASIEYAVQLAHFRFVITNDIDFLNRL